MGVGLLGSGAGGVGSALLGGFGLTAIAGEASVRVMPVPPALVAAGWQAIVRPTSASVKAYVALAPLCSTWPLRVSTNV